MTIYERAIGDVSVLDINGRITVQEGVDQFRDVVQRLLGQGCVKLLLNVRAVPYIDSSALGEIIRAYTTVARRGGALKLLDLTARVHELLAITQLLSVFEHFENERVALASFTRTVDINEGRS
jgi:anti-sigma B factor antagonist